MIKIINTFFSIFKPEDTSDSGASSVYQGLIIPTATSLDILKSLIWIIVAISASLLISSL